MTRKIALRNANRSVVRALDILLSFVSYDEVGITELSQSLNLAKSTVHSLLQTLKDKGLIEQNPENSKYRLGLKAYQLGMRWVKGRDLRIVARRYIQQLSEELGEIVHLSIFAGDQALIIDRIEPSAPFLVVPRIGWALPLHSTAAGKVLLAYSPKEVVNRIVRETKLAKYTASTITDPTELENVLNKVYHQGYALDEEETLSGIVCIAAPIRDYNSVVVASLSITSSVDRCPPERYLELIERVWRGADIISVNLGYQDVLAKAVR
ncbi:MAG: IclR family transcriptional regulator [Dehalococcoidia bacterium]|nr:MAG: IclR family transcriptional regulator [Dehalococcoidia bacterium]